MRRKLIYVPLYHSYEETEVFLDPVIDRHVKKSVGFFDRGKAKKEIKNELRDTINTSVNMYWDEVESEVEKLVDDYGSLSVFQEGIYWDDDMAESQAIDMSEGFGTRNFSYVCELAERGAKIRGTEDMGAYFEHIANNKASLKAGDVIKSAPYIDKRDREIAKRINAKLGGTGILFLGGAHSALKYLDSDIEVTTVKPFDVSVDMRASLSMVLDKKRNRK